MPWKYIHTKNFQYLIQRTPWRKIVYVRLFPVLLLPSWINADFTWQIPQDNRKQTLRTEDYDITHTTESNWMETARQIPLDGSKRCSSSSCGRLFEYLLHIPASHERRRKRKWATPFWGINARTWPSRWGSLKSETVKPVHMYGGTRNREKTVLARTCRNCDGPVLSSQRAPEINKPATVWQ
jgi:hypothetical protein